MNATIKHISYHLPETILTNDALAELYPDWSAKRIYEKTGIRERRIATEGETAGDLAFHAAQRLFEESGTKSSDIDFVLLATQSPDHFLPATACILQNRLGIPATAGAVDFNLGCSAYVYGLALAKGLVVGGMAKKVLFLATETYSKHIHSMDKNVRTLFGDAASATLVETSAKEGGIMDFVLGTDGAGHGMLMVHGGAMRSRGREERREKREEMEMAQTPSSHPKNGEIDDSEETVTSPSHLFSLNSSLLTKVQRTHLTMNGPDIFTFTLDAVPGAVEETLKKNAMTMDDVDLFVFHQANDFMLKALRKVMKIPHEKFYINMEDVGNTVSASIPIALARAAADGALRTGMRVVLVGFGVGLSWGATVVEWR